MSAVPDHFETGPGIRRSDKRASAIARSIEADIIRRGWPIGESLGSENALQQRYRVSRSVLREAIRLVEHHKVARMRRGPGGGLLVCEPDAGPATQAVVIYLENAGFTVADLLNARLVLEPLAASLAAERIDEAGIERLRAVLRAEEDRSRGGSMSPDDFHLALAERSKNPVLQLFIDVLMRLTTFYCPAFASKRQVPPPGIAARSASSQETGCAGGFSSAPSEAGETMDHTRSDHRDIVAAVTAGDSARAKTLTERHVAALTAWLRGHQCGEDAGRTGTLRSRDIAHRPGQAREANRIREFDHEESRGKLAEVLAAAIGDDIAATGCQVGSVFGTETALLQRYGVSRSVLREAVRLLEHHAIAQMRRGPGGGLVVAKPQAQASIDTIALYLQYRKPSREDLRCVRDAIEIDNVAKVVELRNRPEVAAFLNIHTLAIDETSHDGRQAGVEELRFHTGLAQLAGNALLELFLRILIELFRRNWSGTERRLPSWSDAVAVEHAHLRIIEAITAGDDSLARHRSRRHLDAAASWWP